MYASKYSIRQKNTEALLNYIFENRKASRVELSKNIGLSKSSVSDIVNYLIDKPNELIIETGSGSSSAVGGRKPIFLEINPNAGYTLGIDIGVNSIRYVVSSLNGELIDSGKKDVSEGKYYSIVRNLIDKILITAKNTNHGLLNIVISIQGSVNENMILFTPNYNILDIELLKNEFPSIPIYFENEANLAAYAESYFRSENYVSSVTLRTGIGAGIIFNNKIYHGNKGGAGEIGHTVVVPFGNKCPCGNHGCLERYASERAILNSLKEAKNDSNLTIDDFIELYNNGDKDAVFILEKTVKLLGIAISNFIALYSLPKVYVLGDVAEQINEFPQLIKNQLKGVFTESTEIAISKKGKYSSAFGASLFGLRRFFENLWIVNTYSDH